MQICSGVKGALLTAVAAMLVLTTSNAKANGRFPRGEHLIEYPSDPNRLILAATYGLVNTDDGGKNWYYICETAFSLFDPPSSSSQGFTGDPLLQLSADEAIVASADIRITRSTDHACGWTTSFQPTGKTIIDIAAAPSNRNEIFALVQASAGMMQVYESTDGGVKFDPIGTQLSMIVLGYTIDVDPKDPNHVMVTGVMSFTDPESGVLLNSTNKGMTWSSLPIPKTGINAPPFIAAVHPTDSKKIFIRTDEWVDDGAGATFANDALIYTKDGGMTWTELLRAKGADGGGKLFGFAVSPDGGTLLAGYGDPVVGGGRNVDREVLGVYKSSGADYSFGATPKPVFQESATCLTWTAKGIYVCGSPDGMTSYIGFASDVNNVTSAGLQKIMQVNQLKGEPPCCNGRAVASCDWSVDCMRFQACSDGGPVDAGVCTMPEAGRPDSGTGGSAGAAGAGAGTGGAAGAGKDGGAGASTGGSGGAATGGATSTGAGGTAGSDSSCSCRTAGGSNGAGAPVLGVLFGLIGASGWRRSRRQRPNS
jgi:hypothetical protein